jgi:hypothetical protein
MMGGSKLTIKRTTKGVPYASIQWRVAATREIMATALALTVVNPATLAHIGKADTRDRITNLLKTEGMRGVRLAMNGSRRVDADSLRVAYMQIDRFWPELGDIEQVGGGTDAP